MNAPLKNVLISGVILLLALLAAWNEWTDDELRVSDGVSIVENQLEALERVVWSTEDEEVVMEYRTDDAGSYWWVEHTTYEWVERIVEPPRPAEPEPEPDPEPEEVETDSEESDSEDETGEVTEDEESETELAEDSEAEAEEVEEVETDSEIAEDSAEGEESEESDDTEIEEETVAEERVLAPEPEPEPEIVRERVASVRVYKAGSNGDSLVERLAPMPALRQLDSDEATFTGLCDPDDEGDVEIEGTLTLTFSGVEQELEVWCQAYGTRDWYVKKVLTGDVFLVDDELLRPLTQANSRLADRRLWSMETEEIAAIRAIRQDGTTVATTQQDPDTEGANWRRTSNMSVPDSALDAWITELLRVNGTSYHGPEDDELLDDNLNELFRVQFVTAEDRTETLVLYSSGEDRWATSEHTRGYLRVTTTTADGLKTGLEGLSAD